MMAPHVGFIVAAYVVTFAAVAATVTTIVYRHRALKRALARSGDSERAAS